MMHVFGKTRCFGSILSRYTVSMFSISWPSLCFSSLATDAYSKLLDETFSVLLLELVPCDGLVGRAGTLVSSYRGSVVLSVQRLPPLNAVIAVSGTLKH